MEVKVLSEILNQHLRVKENQIIPESDKNISKVKLKTKMKFNEKEETQ